MDTNKLVQKLKDIVKDLKGKSEMLEVQIEMVQEMIDDLEFEIKKEN